MGAIALFASASFMMVAHVFCFNDWSDLKDDSKAASKADLVFTAHQVKPGQMLAFSILLGLGGVVIMTLISLQMGALALGMIATSLVYSHPKIRGKGIPIVSSILHFVGQVMQFLLGYTMFAGMESTGLMISIYFAMIFVAGHLNQETRDFDDDLKSGIQTNAVFFGQRVMFYFSFALFSLSFFYLGWLAYNGGIYSEIGYLVAFYPLYAFFFFKTLLNGLSFKSIKRLEFAYRIVFAVIGLCIISIGLYHLLVQSSML